MTDRRHQPPVPLPPFLAPAKPVPDEADRPSTDDLIRRRRARQAVFERGVALAVVTAMLDGVGHLRELPEALRWVLNEPELQGTERFLRTLREDLLRMQRIEGREGFRDA
jgi:hypothetical protein